MSGNRVLTAQIEAALRGLDLSGGGGGTPGGSNTQIQFNDGGAFGGDSGLTYDKTAHKLTTANLDVPDHFSIRSLGTPGTQTRIGSDAANHQVLIWGGDESLEFGQNDIDRPPYALFGLGLQSSFGYAHDDVILVGHSLTPTADNQTWFGDTVNPVFLVGTPGIVSVSDYFNFGTTPGESGFGLRNNSGTIEAKNSGGEWAALGGGGGSPAGEDTQIQFNDGGAFGADSHLAYNKASGLFHLDTPAPTTPIALLGPTAQHGITVAPNALVAITSIDDMPVLGQALNVFVTDTGGAASGDFNGMRLQVTDRHLEADGTLGIFRGLQMSVLGVGVGATTDMLGLSVTVTATGPVTNAYGVKIEDATGATNNYALYTGTGKVHFGDTVEVVGPISGLTLIQDVVPPIQASPYTAALAGGGAGNVSNGTHSYKFTYTDGTNETDGSGDPTNTVTVTDNSVDGSVTIDIPYTSFYFLNVYRDKDGDGVYKKLPGSPYTNQTQVFDNAADGSLGDTIPSTNTLAVAWRMTGGVVSAGTAPNYNRVRFANLDFVGQDSPDPFGTGASLLIRSGSGATGGQVRILPGDGTTKGTVRIQTFESVDRFVLDADGHLTWSDSDVGFAREDAGLMKVTDGGSGYGELRAGGYKSSDGTDGMTGTVTLAGLVSLTVKNGLITGTA